MLTSKYQYIFKPTSRKEETTTEVSIKISTASYKLLSKSMHTNTEQPTTIFFVLTIDNKSHSIRARVPTDMDILLSVPAPLIKGY